MFYNFNVYYALCNCQDLIVYLSSNIIYLIRPNYYKVTTILYQKKNVKGRGCESKKI